SGKVANYCIKADTTLSFTSAKPVNILKPSAEMCGKTLVAQVGISKDIIDSLPASFSITKEQAVKNMFKKRDPLSHKGMYGKLLMFCGSYGMVGAGIMAARGALRSGVGLLNMVVSKECYPIMATAVPEAVFTIMDDSNEETIKKSSEKLFAAINSATACVIGSGLGEYTEKYLPTVIKFANAPLVLDADALRFLSENLELLKERNAEIVITPHHGEMAKLCKKTTEQIYVDRLLIAKQFSQEHKILTILKGAGTVIASDDGEIKVNTTGNAGMATGGSGDVLAGMIGSLLAQGLSLKDSAVAGVYIHGKAGDICAEKLSQISMLPTDLIEALPEVFSEIETKI
ncbi:MAG: NAD(P)H-hydrate dehydratase, partial [Clostridia bacterium]